MRDVVDVHVAAAEAVVAGEEEAEVEALSVGLGLVVVDAGVVAPEIGICGGCVPEVDSAMVVDALDRKVVGSCVRM